MERSELLKQLRIDRDTARATNSLPRPLALDASSYVTARGQATVAAKITGKIVEVLIGEGMRVEEGDVLARLDDTEAEAQLTAARSQLAEIRPQLEQAERAYARQRELFEKQFVAEQPPDAASTQRDMLRARLAAAGEPIKVAQESVAVARVQMDNTIMRAPFAGVMSSTLDRICARCYGSLAQ